MVTAEDIIEETGCSAVQLEDWIKGGWMSGAQSRLPQPHQRGPGIGLYPEESLARASFLVAALDANRDIIEAGYELFLQHKKLYKGEAYRKVLLLHNQYLERFLRQLITVPADASPSEKRKDIAAEMSRDPGPFNARGQALIGLSMRMLTGSTRKRARAGLLEGLEPDLPPVSVQYVSGWIKQANLATLLHAAQQIDERLSRERGDILSLHARLQAAFQVASDKLPRLLLPWHHCLSSHDMPGVMRPYFTTLEVLPNKEEKDKYQLTMERLMRYMAKGETEST